jgi:hypothetical protein
LDNDDVVRTVLKTHFGLFEYTVMPFGLTNAPSAFMAVMNDVLQGISFVSEYLDDILVFSKHPKNTSNMLPKYWTKECQAIF